MRARFGGRAYQAPRANNVQLPRPEAFTRAEGCYPVAFHEASQLTGAYCLPWGG
jgi:antirestriction protein ArdC